MTTTAFLNAQIVDGRVVLLYRDDAGTLKKKSVPAEFVSYHPKVLHEDPERNERMVRALKRDRRVLAVSLEGDYWRVRWKGKWERREACKAMRAHEVPVFEGDVNPIRRLISDLGLGIAKQRRLYFDLEVDSRLSFAKQRAGEARILSWCARDEEGNRFIAILERWTDEAEQRLIEQFWEVAKRYDQLLAWSGRFGSDTYDFVVLEQRSKRVGAHPGEIWRWNWLDHHDVFERMNKNASESGEEKQSLKLQDVGMVLLGRGKDNFDSSKTYEGWIAAHEAGQTFGHVLHLKPTRGLMSTIIQIVMVALLCPLLRYNVNDVDLMFDVEQKTGYVALFGSLCEACGLFPNTFSLYPTVQMDGFLLRLGVERNYHFPTKWYDKEEPDFQHEKFEGAYVLHPTVTGVVEDVRVTDFASMYPSIIITWNMSLETIMGVRAPDDVPANACRAGTGACFRTDRQGILAFAVQELLRLRDYWRKLKATFPPGSPEAVDAERRSNAYKVAANSFFGASGNRFCRFYNELLAESITTTGAWLNKSTMAVGREAPWFIDPIYGDTDASMVVGVTRERFDEFVDWANRDFYPRIVAETGAKMIDGFGRVKLEHEKGYRRIVFIKKNDGKAASKRYIGIYDYYKGKAADDSSKPEIKGIEWKRGDSLSMLRRMQWDIVEVFWKGDWKSLAPFMDVVEKWRRHVLDEPLTIDEIKIAQSITKPIGDYVVKKKKAKPGQTPEDAAQPAHVRIAKLLKERGQEIGEGTRIEYYMHEHATRDVRPAMDFDGTCDRHFIWEKKLYPACQRLFEAIRPEHDWTQYRKTRPQVPRQSRRKAKIDLTWLTEDPFFVPPPRRRKVVVDVEVVPPPRRRRCVSAA